MTRLVPILMLAAVAAARAQSPAEFRLEPGTELSIAVDPAQRLRPANRLVGGISFHRVAGWAGRPYAEDGRYTLTPEIEQAIRGLQLPLTRFYALGDERFPEVVIDDPQPELAPGLEAAIDRAAAVLARLGIPEQTVVLEFENQGARTMLSPEVWARGVKYAVAKGYGFRYWEIGNEPYVNSSIFRTPADYVRHFQEVAAAVKEVQPEAKTVISIWRDDVKWGRDILSAAAGSYDLVAPHWYTFVRDDFEETVIGDNFEMASRIAAVVEYIRQFNPGRDVAQYDTEWGMLSSPADGGAAERNVRNANILGTAYRAVRLISYVREDLVRAASGWEMFVRTPSYSCCTFASDAEDRRSMLYWMYYYFNRHVGDWTVAGSGTAPFYKIQRAKTQAGKAVPETPALLTVSEDGNRVYAVLVNGSWTHDCPATLALKDFAVGGVTAVALWHDDLDAIPLLYSEQDFVHPLAVEATGSELRFTLPAHAIAFLTIERAPGAPDALNPHRAGKGCTLPL